jgi:hypothetical protein
VTTRDVLVQLGFLMVTAGAMLAAWAVFTGQFFKLRRGHEVEEDEEDEEDEEPRPRPRRGDRPRPS